MSEPFLERLSRFTPDSGSLNRDALLFAAGRASARPNRGWIGLAGLLASTQAVSLVLLGTHPAPPVSGSAPLVAAAPTLPPSAAPPGSDSAASPGVWSAHHILEVPESDERPESAVTFVDSGPPLRAVGSAADSVLH